jgi:hypothetical protein
VRIAWRLRQQRIPLAAELEPRGRVLGRADVHPGIHRLPGVAIRRRGFGQKLLRRLERPDRLERDVLHPGAAEANERIGAALRDQADDLFHQRAHQRGRVDPDLPARLHVQRALDVH